MATIFKELSVGTLLDLQACVRALDDAGFDVIANEIIKLSAKKTQFITNASSDIYTRRQLQKINADASYIEVGMQMYTQTKTMLSFLRNSTSVSSSMKAVQGHLERNLIPNFLKCKRDILSEKEKKMIDLRAAVIEMAVFSLQYILSCIGKDIGFSEKMIEALKEISSSNMPLSTTSIEAASFNSVIGVLKRELSFFLLGVRSFNCLDLKIVFHRVKQMDTSVPFIKKIVCTLEDLLKKKCLTTEENGSLSIIDQTLCISFHDSIDDPKSSIDQMGDEIKVFAVPSLGLAIESVISQVEEKIKLQTLKSANDQYIARIRCRAQNVDSVLSKLVKVSDSCMNMKVSSTLEQKLEIIEKLSYLKGTILQDLKNEISVNKCFNVDHSEIEIAVNGKTDHKAKNVNDAAMYIPYEDLQIQRKVLSEMYEMLSAKNLKSDPNFEPETKHMTRDVHFYDRKTYKRTMYECSINHLILFILRLSECACRLISVRMNDFCILITRICTTLLGCNVKEENGNDTSDGSLINITTNSPSTNINTSTAMVSTKDKYLAPLNVSAKHSDDMDPTGIVDHHVGAFEILFRFAEVFEVVSTICNLNLNFQENHAFKLSLPENASPETYYTLTRLYQLPKRI
eukprot:Awhi_evm1s5073